HTDTVWSVTFSPDSSANLLASGSADGTVILWDTASRRMIGQPLRGHDASVNNVAFSSDGKCLASASDDRTIVVWDVDPASWREQACRIANRPLTEDEWQQYLVDATPFHELCRRPPGGG
ncbi:MAG: WD40 repeat domain-containing protein, partial [Anaerolineae bacterium]